jgi:hypothetical protein
MLARTGETAKRKQRLPMLTQNNQHELKVSKRAGCAARASAVFSKPFARYVRYQTLSSAEAGADRTRAVR